MRIFRRSPAIAALALSALPAAAQDCADGQRAFAHLGGTTCIPENPQRVIGMHDQQVTLSLLELGVPVVGSHGRLDDDGTPYMRSVDLALGLDFENSGIAFTGDFNAPDYEAMAALQPDLIVAREWELEQADQLSAIAPTVFIPNDPVAPLNFSRGIAEATGTLETWERLHATYKANIARAKAAMPDVDGATYGKIQGWDGKLNIFAGYGGLTKILADLGFERVPFAQEMSDRGVTWGEEVSAELLPEVAGADYVFDTYTIAYGDTLASPNERMEGIIATWCDVVTACAEGRYIVLPREVAGDFSFGQLNTTIHLVATHIARAPVPAD